MLSYVRQAIAANGGTPSSYSLIDSWRQLVTAYGGTPTQYTVTGLIREAITAVGGTPTQFGEVPLLRGLLVALGVSVTSYRARDLYAQLAVAVAAPADPAPIITSTNPSDAYDQSATVSGTLTANEAVTWSKSGPDTAKLTLNTSTGAWSLDTSAVGALAITITATDTAGNTADQAWSFTIAAAPSGLPTPTLTWTSGTSTYDPTFTLTEITEADVVELQIDDDPAFGSLYGSDTNTIDASEALTGEVTFPAIPTLALSTTYYARARYTRGPDTSAWSTSVSKTMASDTTAPTLSSPTDTANGSTGATISVSTNEGNGLLYWAVTTSSTPPTATALKAGTGAAAFGNQAVSGTGVQNASPTGLTASTAYYAHFLHRDAAGNDSSIASADGFSTGAAATLPTSGLILRLDADDTSTLFQTITGTTSPADGQPIGTWNDKSGGAFNLTAAANDTTRPTYRTNSGLPYVEFDGTNDILRRLAALGMYSGGACTIMIAMRTLTATQSSNNLTFVMEGNSASNNAVYSFGSSNPTGVVPLVRDNTATALSGTTSTLLSANALDGADVVIGITDDGSTLQAYDDGVAGSSRPYTRAGTFTLNRFAVGGLQRTSAGNFLGMRVYAVAVWNRVLDSTERGQARTYMGTKQGRSL